MFNWVVKSVHLDLIYVCSCWDTSAVYGFEQLNWNSAVSFQFKITFLTADFYNFIRADIILNCSLLSFYIRLICKLPRFELFLKFIFIILHCLVSILFINWLKSIPNMDTNYKPLFSLDVAKLPSRKPSPRFSMVTNVSTIPGQSPLNYK